MERIINRLTEDFLRYALSIGALEIIPKGRKLKSGRMSPYFFNAGLFTNGKALDRLSGAYAERYLESKTPVADVLYGPAYKGIPLVTALAMKLYLAADIPISWAFNRKEEKDHGEGGMIVGASMRGKRVMIVDDVMTSGISSAEAMEIVIAQGGEPVGTLLAFDRQERGIDTDLSAVQDFEKRFGIPVFAAATLSDLLSYMRDNNHPAVDAIEEYRAEYGVLHAQQKSSSMEEIDRALPRVQETVSQELAGGGSIREDPDNTEEVPGT